MATRARLAFGSQAEVPFLRKRALSSDLEQQSKQQALELLQDDRSCSPRIRAKVSQM